MLNSIFQGFRAKIFRYIVLLVILLSTLFTVIINTPKNIIVLLVFSPMILFLTHLIAREISKTPLQISEIIKKKDEEINRHLQELSALNTIASEVNQSLDLKIILQNSLREVLKVTRMNAGWIYLPDSNGELSVSAYQGIEPEFISEINTMKSGEGIAGKVAITGETIISEDISCDPRISRTKISEKGYRALAGIPLKAKEKNIGVMIVTSRLPHLFIPDEVELLCSIGNQIGTAIEKSQLYENLKSQLHETETAQNQFARAARLAFLGEVAANVAHEINNPLTGILTYTSILLDHFPESDPKRKKLNTIYDETMRIKYIVRNLLDFARQGEMKKQKVDIIVVIKDSLNLILHLIKLSRIKIIEDYEKNIPAITVDISQIKQVLLNLFNNALYVMPNGGELAINVFIRESMLNIQIRDSGPGIPENIINKIFDPFFTTKPETKGTGLGLSVSHGIIEKHGGKIEVESATGKGSVFTVRLPI